MHQRQPPSRGPADPGPNNGPTGASDGHRGAHRDMDKQQVAHKAEATCIESLHLVLDQSGLITNLDFGTEWI